MSIPMAGLTIRGGGHANVRRGPFSYTQSQDFPWGCTFLPRKKWRPFFSRQSWRPFLVVITYLGLHRASKQCVKNWQLVEGPLPLYNRHSGYSSSEYSTHREYSFGLNSVFLIKDDFFIYEWPNVKEHIYVLYC